MQDKFPVLIPIKEGHYLSKCVTSGLIAQSLELEIYVVSNPVMEEDFSSHNNSNYYSQAKNRNKLFHIGYGLDTDYVFMIDADKEIKKKNVFEKMKNRLEYNEKYGACFLVDYYSGGEHIDIGCFCIRREIMPEIRFFSPNNHTCNCRSLTDKIKLLGYECNIINDSSIISHIGWTR